MDKQILKIQIESDLAELLKDSRLGVYDETPEEYIKAQNCIWEKVDKFIDEIQKESDFVLGELKSLTGVVQKNAENLNEWAELHGAVQDEATGEWTV